MKLLTRVFRLATTRTRSKRGNVLVDEKTHIVKADDSSELSNERKVALVEAFMAGWIKAGGFDSIITDDFLFGFPEHEMTAKDVAPVSAAILASFPDFKLEWESITVQQDGSVYLRGNIASGTHTGAPFGFGPFEPIDATGKRVQNDPEDIKFYFRGDKLCRNEFVPNGGMAGPAGLYTQLGGFPAM